MANTLSAAKRARQTERRTARNRKSKARFKTLKKKVEAAVETGNKEEVLKQVSLYSSALDMAAKQNVIHRNAAARRKSHVSKLVAKVS